MSGRRAKVLRKLPLHIKVGSARHNCFPNACRLGVDRQPEKHDALVNVRNRMVSASNTSELDPLLADQLVNIVKSCRLEIQQALKND